MGDCPTVPLPGDQHPLNPQLADQKIIVHYPCGSIQDGQEQLKGLVSGGGKRKKWRDRGSLQKGRDSLLVRERSKELGWNWRAVPWWCRDFVQISYSGMAGFGMFCAEANEDEVSYFWYVLLVPLSFLAEVRDPTILQSPSPFWHIQYNTIQDQSDSRTQLKWADFQAKTAMFLTTIWYFFILIWDIWLNKCFRETSKSRTAPWGGNTNRLFWFLFLFSYFFGLVQFGFFGGFWFSLGFSLVWGFCLFLLRFFCLLLLLFSLCHI